MSQLERANDFEASLKAQILAQLLVLQTSMPVRVEAYDPVTMSVTCQPLIKARVPLPNGGFVWVKLPVLIFCPVINITGAVFTMAFPPKVGSEGLAIFSSRAIDNWWVAGGIQNPIELRHHDLSDGFVIVGPRSKPNALANPVATDRIRSEDGTVFLDFSMGGITIEAPIVALNGVLSTTGVAVPGTTLSTFALPIVVTIGGVPTTMYLRLSAAP